jgi:cytochrome c5
MWSRMVAACAALLLAPTALHAQGGQGAAAQLPPGDGRELVQTVCTSCHTLVPVMMKRDGEGGWRHTVGRMVLQRQAQLMPDEFDAIVKYLSTVYGPWTTQMQTGPLPPGSLAVAGTTAKEAKLPEGPGKELVETRCTACHDLGRVVSITRKKQEWEDLTHNMIGRGPAATPAQVDAIIGYFTTHFLEKAEE